MSQFKIKFHDQLTGRQHEIEANQLEKSWSANPAEKSFDSSEVGDGNVDLLVKDEGWIWDNNRHLGVDTRSMTSDEATALKRALEDPRSANVRVFDMLSGRELSDLRILKTDAAGEVTTLSDNLDTTGTRRPVQLTPSGQVATPNGGEPTTPQEIGDGLFRAASLIDDIKGNLFDEIQAPLSLKQKFLGHLTEALGSVAPGEPLPAGMDETQALQMRSSAATTLLELFTGKHQLSNDFKAEAFDVYEQALQRETNPLLRDSMVMNLDRLRSNLPQALRERIDTIKGAHDVAQPPYEKWFADGNDTVKVDWSVGHGEGFLEDNVAHLKRRGFEVVDDNHGHPVMEKTYVKDGVETKFQIAFRTIRNDMFESVDDDDTQITIYSGHSNWGRNVRDSLKRAPEATGDGKVIMTNLCVGKGEMQQMKDAYPDSQLITTYNSGYFRPGDTAEWHHAVDALFEGIAERTGYEEIADDTRDRNPFQYTHDRAGVDNNYIFPTDLKTRREVLDADHDGQADVFDRMVNFNTFDVKTDTAREFTAIEPSRDADELVGTKIHFAAMSTNRISIYNEALKYANGTAEVLPAGFHEAAEGDTGLFRFERNQDDRLEMSMDSRFAHMSEEALRMASAFEYSMFKGTEGGSWPFRNQTDNLLHAMVLASQSLNSDAGYRDRQVWSEFTKAYNLPDISLSDIASAREADSHYYSGSNKSVSKLKTTLNPDILEQLAQPGTGVLSQD
jgi:hypothetical protein